MFNIDDIVRPNIKGLVPYSSARNEYTGKNAIFLDANENPFNAPLNRYPDPLQFDLKRKISRIKNVAVEKIFLGNGSDEPIDLLIRAFCEPGADNIISISPSYGMYEVCADINNIEFRKVLLTPDFQLDVEPLLKVADAKSKILFLCSPNNPTSNCLKREDMIKVIEEFKGLVVIDEAYIDFAPCTGMLDILDKYKNMVILHTFSKAWGLAGIRLGMCFADPQIIDYLNKIKYPYNINILTQNKAFELIENYEKEKDGWVKTIVEWRERLIKKIGEKKFTIQVYPSDANFFMAKIDDPKRLLTYLRDQGIIIRDRSKVALCEGCLRFTVGTPEENTLMLDKLVEYERLNY
ncbi:MAG: histidinol-phosphate transaminase [Bacteroidales bacterium]|nr:histidinol-phosphate transaminase [Bacteroidales bacterium]